MANLTPLLLNNVAGTVQAGSSAIGSSSATGVNVGSGEGAAFGTIGTNQYIPAVIADGSTTPPTVKEYVWITARATDALTILRQAEDSSRYAASTTTIQAGYTIAAVASAFGGLGQFVSHSVGLTLPRDRGWLTQNMPGELVLTLGATYTSGNIYLMRIPVPVTMPVTNILMYCTAFGSTLTSGQNLAGLYDSSGTRLGQTADQTTSWGGSSGLKTMAISGGPITVTGGPDVYVYAAVLGVGTTPAKFARVNPGIGGLTLANAGTSTGTAFFLRAATGQTSLPSSLTLASGDSATDFSNQFWVALS